MARSSSRTVIFWALNLITVISGITLGYFLNRNAELDILPLIESTVGDDQEGLRTPGTFHEDTTSTASEVELIIHEDGSFTNSYKKSSEKIRPFAGVWFPLENVDLDFSQYSYLEIGIEAKNARRIPLNLSVQNNLESHQYVRKVLEIRKGVVNYELPLDEFETPAEWYEANNVAQIDIPDPDFSKVEAISFESCQLIEAGMADEYTITKLALKKDPSGSYSSIAAIVVVLLVLFYYMFKERH